MKEERKQLIIISSFLFLLLSLFILESYGLFETNVNVPVEQEIAKWQVLINGSALSEELSTFTIDEANWNYNPDVASGKAAPGSSAYFEILIDPSGTEVSIEYELILDFANLNNEMIYITNVSNQDNQALSLNEENSYVGVILLADVLANKTEKIRVDFVWENDESNNEIDSENIEFGNLFLEIPISIRLLQHLG